VRSYYAIFAKIYEEGSRMLLGKEGT